jgi:DtxR family Mn-dependent transcriptional regulator
MRARRSDPPPEPAPDERRPQEPSPSEEMYLKTLERLEREEQASVANLGRALGVSTPSASAMVRRLTARSWMRMDERKPRLTPAGRALALRTIRRHRLLERFLADTLQIPWEEVHEPACALEHAVTDMVTDRLEESLGHPTTCPHGHPIPERDGSIAPLTGVGLDTIEPGGRARVLRISREEPELLSYLGALGLVPGAVASVETAAPFGGPLLVSIGRARYALARDVAGLIAVEPIEAREG